MNVKREAPVAQNVRECHEREGIWDNRCLKSGDRLELNTKKPERGMDRGTEQENDRAAGWRANELGFRQKCQMSQRHSGKTLLFNMAPPSATEPANLQ